MYGCDCECDCFSRVYNRLRVCGFCVMRVAPRRNVVGKLFGLLSEGKHRRREMLIFGLCSISDANFY